MRLYYQDRDITDRVDIRECVVRDACGGRCDSLDIYFDNLAAWYGWGPEDDDRIRVTRDGYDSGTMYVNTVVPEGRKYRIYAGSLPCGARRRESRSFVKRTVAEILQSCAMRSGMSPALYGVEGGVTIPYIEQRDETAAAFLHRLMRLEGAALKCVNGKYAGIGLLYAQGLPASRKLTVRSSQAWPGYRRAGERLRSVTVRTPYAEATATDSAAASGRISLVTGEYPAMDGAQAGRWARGLLMSKNRECETFTIPTEFDPGFTAMARVDIEGDTAASGEWLVEEVEHDIKNGTSTARMHRCITTVR